MTVSDDPQFEPPPGDRFDPAEPEWQPQPGWQPQPSWELQHGWDRPPAAKVTSAGEPTADQAAAQY